MEESRPLPGLRSALFPLVVVVLLVYLASQTFLGTEDQRVRTAYSEAKALVRDSPEEIEGVVFVPSSQRMEIHLADGRELETSYPSGESQLALEKMMDTSGVRYDSRGTGESAWWSFGTYLLPFALFFGFWIFMMRRGAADRGDSAE
jgi:ATP-dependent Zn protease